MPSGRIRERAGPLEVTTARICREAGATVKTNVYLRDMNVSVHSSNERRIEILAQGLSIRQDGQLAIDVTLRSSTTTDNSAHPQAADVDGAIANGVKKAKENNNPEFANGRNTLIILAVEVGGRLHQ